MAYNMYHHDVAYFLKVYIPKDLPVAQSESLLQQMQNHICEALDSNSIGDFSDMQTGNPDHIILHYDCDRYGGVVKGLSEDELLTIFSDLSSSYPDVYFHLYAEDEDDGKQNSTYVFLNGKYREDHSLLIDSSLQLEPQKKSTYVLTCKLDEDCLGRVTTLLKYIGCDYNSAVITGDVPEAEQTIYRFELFFNGERQDIGLLHGLSDVLSGEQYRILMRPFKEGLPAPEDMQPCCFFFTEAGLRKFSGDIDAINRAVQIRGWDVGACSIQAHEADFLYQDELQVALCPEALNYAQYAPFQHADDLLDSSSSPFKN